MSVTPAHAALERNVHWYHTIELAPGVVTPGQIDWRERSARMLPADMSGMRALDVGTFDGFWAFEMERRGANVVALDLPGMAAAEWPPLNRDALLERQREWDMELGKGFAAASDALGSRVDRVIGNVYDLDPEMVGGAMDLIFCGDVLIHVRDPTRAVERMHDTLRPGGELISLEPFSVRDTLLGRGRPLARFEPLISDFNWWRPNLAAHAAWIRSTGFVDIRRTGFHRPPSHKAMRQWRVTVSARRAA
jgi:SAM-dependent methyltransferase